MSTSIEYCDGCSEPFCTACQPDAMTPSPDRHHLYCERCQARSEVEEVA